MNDERSSYNNAIFLQHLKATHEQATTNSATSPKHTCIMKCNMKYNNNKSGTFNRSMVEIQTSQMDQMHLWILY